MALVETEIHGHVAVVTLHDPDRRNALTRPMVTEIVDTFDRIEADESLGAVVVTGAPPAFCAGADLGDLGSTNADPEAGRAGLLGIYEGFLRVGRCKLPTIAAVNGAAVGAGTNLALVCDVRLAAERAKFDTRFLQIGIHPGGGHTWMFRREAGPQTAAAAILFGEVLSGADAERVGLVWRCLPDDELLPAAIEMAGRAASAPRGVLTRTKATLADVPAIATHPEAVERELAPQVWSTQQPEFAERIAALKAKVSKK
ncbi:MAG TPA: enoyl-CoA hydratase [Acidimicrobiales bacterium]|jgi:enoyl-CoA hydratase|nr:enoyl-CoA hydratase [Acidimicrobiales bacterium]